MTYRRLPLSGLHNARDLGGYPVSGGGATAFARFIRCEAPRALTPGDIAFLRDYGVTDAIDFRGGTEVRRHPHSLENADWARYSRCPTFNAQVAFGSPRGNRPAANAFVDWGEKYVEMAEKCRNWVRDVMTEMSGASGCVLFNCTTGKDRTGIISALLLGLAGVSDADIIADYCVSELYLNEIYKELLSEYLKRWPDVKADLDSPFFKTAPGNMRALLTHFNNRYGGIEGYVKACDVPDAEISVLRERLAGA